MKVVTEQSFAKCTTLLNWKTKNHDTHIQRRLTKPTEDVFASLAHHLRTPRVPFDWYPTHWTRLDISIKAIKNHGIQIAVTRSGTA